MGWRAWDNYEETAHREWKRLPWRERYPAQIIVRLIAFLLIAAALLWHAVARADDKPPAISENEAKTLIEKVKQTWRAQDGETAEQIIAKVSKVVHFIPRGWDYGSLGDGTPLVFFNWARSASDTKGDEYNITFTIDAKGRIAIEQPYAKTMEFGWQPFALSLIDSEITDEVPAPDRRFLHDLANFNSVETPQGKLGDLLQRGRCKLLDPVALSYVPKIGDNKPGDYFRLQLSVNCDIPGPRYFTHEGVILFEKRGNAVWQPSSFFSKRLARYAPGHLFDESDPQEQQTFDILRKKLQDAGMIQR